MQAAPAKFMFDDDFTAGGTNKPSISLVEHAARLRETEASALARGRQDGMAETRREAEVRAAAALERIAAAIENLHRSLSGIEARLEKEAVEVAVAVAKKLAPELVRREPMAEIAALATECFRHLVATPHVAVRINEAQYSAACQKLEEIVRRCGLESRLIVLAEPDIAVGDCRIEWADGGVVRDSNAVAEAIDEAVTRYIAALAQTNGAQLHTMTVRIDQ